MKFRKKNNHEATILEFSIYKSNNPSCCTSDDTLLPHTNNLQVIKLLQRYIWCEHIQYSNDLKVRQDGEKKTTWININTKHPEILNCIISEKM